MVRTVSLLPLAAAMLSVFLAAVASSGARPRNVTVRYFVLLNAFTGLWSLMYFFVLNLSGGDHALVAPFGTPAHALLIGSAVGVAGAPTYWFLFCASYARKPYWCTSWRAILVHVPIAYSLVVTATNPLHRLFAAEIGGAVRYGPLAPPHQVTVFVLVIAGIWMLVSSAWARGTKAGRTQGLLLGLASGVPALGGIAWSLRFVLGLPLQVNPTPILFPVLNLVLAYEMLGRGLADIAPHAALQAFEAISDGAIGLDDDGVVVAVNNVARRLFPRLQRGVQLDEGSVELREAAQACLGSAAGYTGFDLELDGLLYWVRVRRTTDRRGCPSGCIILLSDVTELRATQARIVELSRVVEGDGPGLRIEPGRAVDRRRRQA